MITSTGNAQMKNVVALMKKAKERKEQGLFVVEGRKMFEEAPKDWISSVYVSESFCGQQEVQKLLEGRTYEVVSDAVFKSISDTKTPQGILCLVKMPQYGLSELLQGERTHLLVLDYEVVSDAVFKSISDTKTPQGILCLVKMPQYGLSELLQGERTHLLVLESIQDPGNLGTMLRTGEGAGVTGVILNRTTVDLFNPKTIRSTMGSIYRVPFFVADDLEETLGELRTRGIRIYAAHLGGSVPYDEPSYCGATAFLIGNEGNGLTDGTAALADARVRIPMEGQVESLNAAVSAALLMYEANRQRRAEGGKDANLV